MRQLNLLSGVVVSITLLFANFNVTAEEGHWVRAIADGDVQAVAEALEQGMSAEARAADGTSALEMAIRLNRLAVVRLLLEAGADSGSSGHNGEPLIVTAVQRGNPAIIAALLETGADPAAPARGGLSAWELALHRGDFEVAAEFIVDEEIAGKLQRRFEAQDKPDEKWYYLAGKLSQARGDLVQAESYLHKASEYPSKHLAARYSLVELYVQQKNWNEAMEMLDDWRLIRRKKATREYLSERCLRDEADTLCAFTLAFVGMKDGGLVSLPDRTTADAIVAAADKGFLPARYVIGRVARTSQDVLPQRVVDKAWSWLEESADAGLAAAANELGQWSLQMGEIDTAQKWYRRSGELGDLSIYCHTASNIASGQWEWPKDEALALEWYREGAENGAEECLLKLAEIYKEGRLGVAPDAQKAAQYYDRFEKKRGEDPKYCPEGTEADCSP